MAIYRITTEVNCGEYNSWTTITGVRKIEKTDANTVRINGAISVQFDELILGVEKLGPATRRTKGGAK